MASTTYDLKLKISAENQATAELQKLNNQVSGIGKTIGGLAISKALVSGMKNLSSQALVLGGNLEQAEIAFTTMLGSGEEADKMLKDLSNFAKNTPFELIGIRDSAKQLMAYGFEAGEIIPTLKSLGDVASGLSVPIGQLALPMGQVRVAGKLMTQDLKQFQNAGVDLVGELSKNLKKSKAEIQSMISAGQITADMVTEAFTTMTSEGGRFENLMEKQSGTYQGMMSNLQDSIDSIKETIGRTFIPILEKVLDKINPIIGKVSERIENNPELATTIATVVAGAIALIGALSGLSAILPMITSGITLLTGPIGLITAGIALLATAWINNRGGIQEKTQEVVGKITEIIQPRLDKLSAWWNEWGGVVIEVVKGTRTLVQDIFVSAFEIIGAGLEVFFQGIDVLIKVFSGDWEGAWQGICNIWKTLRDTTLKIVDNLFGDALDWIADKLVSFGDWFKQKWEWLKTTITGIFTAMWEGIKTAFEFWVAVFTGDWETAGNIISGIVSGLDETLTGIFGDMWENIKGAFQRGIDWVVEKVETFKETVMGIIDGIKEAWNDAKDFVGGIGDGISNVASSAWNGAKNLLGFANGGSVTGGTPIIVGERGPELFVPNSNGTIVPNEEITSTNNVTINMSGITIREDADITKLAEEIVRMTKLEKNYGII